MEQSIIITPIVRMTRGNIRRDLNTVEKIFVFRFLFYRYYATNASEFLILEI